MKRWYFTGTYRFTRGERWTLGLLLAALVYILARAWMPGATEVSFIRCPWHTAFGVECPGCGITRAATSVVRGQFLRAYTFNPLIVFVALWVAYRFAAIGTGLATGRKLVERWPPAFINGFQYAFLAVYFMLGVVRVAAWAMG